MEMTTRTTATRKGNHAIIRAGQVAVMVMVEVAVRCGVGPLTLRFSEVWIVVHRIPLTSAARIAAFVGTPTNVGGRRRMRPPGPGCLVETFTRGDGHPATERSTNG